VKYGFAVLRNMVEKDFLAEALDEVKRMVGNGLPLEQWTKDNVPSRPGTHKLVQKCVMDDPDWQFPKNWADIPESEPFEFVPKAGDVLFVHHLVAHEGNPCCTRMPRVSLHCQALRDEWLNEVDPATPNLSPWARSLALNGHYKTRCDEKKMMLDYYGSKKSTDQKAKLAAQYR
jgi:hypothetical protein